MEPSYKICRKICIFGSILLTPLQGQWLEALKPEFKKPYYKELFTKVGQEYQRKKIFPAPDDIFNAFHLTPLDQVKVVILGQDPYHNDGQAPVLFGKAGCGDPPVSGEYLSGAS